MNSFKYSFKLAKLTYNNQFLNHTLKTTLNIPKIPNFETPQPLFDLPYTKNGKINRILITGSNG